MDKFLKEGDIIELKAGMSVYTQVAEGFIYSNARTSMKKKTQSKIILGEVLDNTLGKTMKTSRFIGKYVVENTEMTGGSSGHDTYPDGWKITARKLKKDGTYSPKADSVCFYQSGCFTAMIESDCIQAIGKMKVIEKAFK